MTDIQGDEVARLRAGNTQAFRSLMERLQYPITGYLHRLVGEREVALDLAQDTFLQVYKEIGKTSSHLELDAWIYRIATNFGLRYLNRKRRYLFIPFSFGSDNLEDEMSGMRHEDMLESSLIESSFEERTETSMLMQEAFKRLAPTDAACIQLHYGAGFTYEQIGDIVNISPEAVRKRVARGIEKFRKVYAQDAAIAYTKKVSLI
ncbi:MAG: sigma-70 family RNA polymerase sigma factor [Ktedonobacteraceae bacterium]